MHEPIYIAASCDDNYVQHVAALFCSVLANTCSPERVHFYLISAQINDESLNKLSLLIKAQQASITFIPADESKFSGFPTLRYGMAAYQRLSLADYLPSNVHRAIYLDADTIVLDDIALLWEIDLGGNGLAAVENLSPKACRAFKFDRQDYFNSGVLLIDIDKWRAMDVFSQSLHFINKNKETLHFIDQCTLNAVFSKQWTRLSLRWNQQADIFGVRKKYADGCGYSRADMTDAIRTPGVVHYIGRQKPWLLNCFHPYQSHYHYYLGLTPWAQQSYIDDTLCNRLKRMLSWQRQFKQWRIYSTMAKKI